MRVLTVFAHNGSGSFCHALLNRFDAGLRDAGHVHDIDDLYAIDFDPVLREHDSPNWMDANAPDDVLERWNLRERMLEGAGGPLRRFAVRRWLGSSDTREIIRRLQEHRPADVLEQQRRVQQADALVFLSPMYFVGFPAMLKGWIERVFTLGFAFGLEPKGWQGDISGRIPLLTHSKALVMQTTIFDERAYDNGLRDALRVLVDEFALHYPGIQRIEREYFYAVHDGDRAKLQRYLERAYTLGREF